MCNLIIPLLFPHHKKTLQRKPYQANLSLSPLFSHSTTTKIICQPPYVFRHSHSVSVRLSLRRSRNTVAIASFPSQPAVRAASSFAVFSDGYPSGSPPFYDCVVRRDRQSSVPLSSLKTRDIPTDSQIACVRERASLGAEVETVPAPTQTLVKLHIVSDQLFAEAKHLKDFRKYNPKTFDGSMDDPTKAQMWLTFVETIFRYMKCPNDQKVQCAVLFLTDRGIAWWETIERMLGGNVNQINWEQFKESFYEKFFSASLRYAKQQEFLNLEQNDMTVEQYDVEFDMLSRFSPDIVRNEAVRTKKFVSDLRLDLLGFVRVFRPTTTVDALRLVVDKSLHKRADTSKAARRGSTPSRKRKAELQPALVRQKNLRSSGVFQRHRQELAAAGRTLRALPVCHSCGRFHGGRCLAGSGVCYKCKQPGHIADFCP
ncbi:gag-protease polyprotein [Cucumis melo var. makuwa]|uniref:Gag-protease polyprotein n=1 Tax=Cucumis melo var. makuwa TaxID=1194695 RepID=A0A5D3BYB8_CUCMM|nr:gag-protease polyprotein [Cucumis melo var. makuwa]